MQQRTSALFAICFATGVLGGFINSLAVWLSGHFQLTAMAGVNLAPDFTPAWLYPRLVWGGIWGLVFWLTVGPPRAKGGWIRKGLWVSLLPTAVQLFYIFPYRTPHGMGGLALGTLTPAFVLVFNAVWGFVTALFARLFWGKG